MNLTVMLLVIFAIFILLTIVAVIIYDFSDDSEGIAVLFLFTIINTFFITQELFRAGYLT